MSIENRHWWLFIILTRISDLFSSDKSFDISEANCYRNIKWIEDILIQNSDFQQSLLVKSTNKWLF
ncbi:hypothetical protein [Spiroplasma poulsonii]|uniref:hypothetical protein n=1 Tax=Spiroplasma poulsonii TaxID=2138 RepID=UPI001F4D1D2C|nr:hypothetical protein [Spiroplasma poulsonii]UNF62486.1 hypothetical protein MNU24_03235 [Spiroplasma poulsonii]